jgi:hypothetical protein
MKRRHPCRAPHNQSVHTHDVKTGPKWSRLGQGAGAKFRLTWFWMPIHFGISLLFKRIPSEKQGVGSHGANLMGSTCFIGLYEYKSVKPIVPIESALGSMNLLLIINANYIGGALVVWHFVHYPVLLRPGAQGPWLRASKEN